jgi:uncharacterized membrane protein YphA (DoxX/SURF4 family)
VHVALWIIAGLLALAFLAAGLSKITGKREDMVTKTAYVEDFPQGVIKAIGVAEVLAAIGLIVPAVTGIGPVLVPIAATGLVLLMAGAVATHLRRGDGFAAAVPSLVLGVLAAAVAWGRFGPYAF